MPLDDRAADRQADSHSVAPGGIEGLEQPLGILRLKSDPRIPHQQGYPAVLAALRSHRQLPRAIGDLAHGVRGVEQQVEDDLLQLDPIAGHGREAIRQLQA